MCVLRVFGSDFDPVAALVGSTLQPYATFRRGDRRFKTSEATHDSTGIKVAVSDADWTDREGQFKDATTFIHTHMASLLSLAQRSDVESMVLDFPFESTGVVTCVRIPLDLARQASDMRIAIEISMYPSTDEESE